MYRAPVREVRFVLEELLGAGRLAACPELAEYSDELAQSVLEEAARFAENVLEPLNRPGDVDGARWTPEGRGHRARLSRGVPAVRRTAAGRRSAPQPEFGGQRGAAGAGERGGRVLGLRQSRLQARPDADARRRACARAVRLGAAEGAVPAEDGARRMDRHHGAHRAAGGLGSRPGAHPRRARGRSLPAVRPEDLHHLGRSRSHQQHHPHGARAHRGRAERASRASRCSSCRRCW